MKPDGTIAARRFVAIQKCRALIGRHQDARGTVAIEIAERQARATVGVAYPATSGSGHVVKVSLAVVQKKMGGCA